MRIQHRQIIPTGENSFVECLIHKGKSELRGYWKTVEISVEEFIKMYPRQAKEMNFEKENTCPKDVLKNEKTLSDV